MKRKANWISGLIIPVVIVWIYSGLISMSFTIDWTFCAVHSQMSSQHRDSNVSLSVDHFGLDN